MIIDVSSSTLVNLMYEGKSTFCQIITKCEPTSSFELSYFSVEDNTAGRELVPVQPREITEIAISEEEERSWSDKVSSGILIGAKWVSWGLAKGAQVTSHLVEQVGCLSCLPISF